MMHSHYSSFHGNIETFPGLFVENSCGGFTRVYVGWVSKSIFYCVSHTTGQFFSVVFLAKSVTNGRWLQQSIVICHK